MSRFYDALKEANRSNTIPVGSSAGSVGDPEIPTNEVPISEADSLQADLLDLAGINIRRTAPHHHVGEATQPAESAETSPFPVTYPSVTSDSDRNGHTPSAETPQVPDAPRSVFESKVVKGFDPRARLIPHAMDPAVVEHYRRLRTKILQRHMEKPFQSLMVTSPGPQEGKTVTVLNLGLSFAMLPNFNVLVIDGDLRRGSIGKWLGADEYPGLSDVLEGPTTLEDVALKCAGVSMHVVTRGNSKVSPGELLHSPRLASELRRITNHFDLVLIDTPPVTLITDSQLLAGARAFHTKRKALEQSVRELSGFRVIGTVLNGGTRAELYRKYNGYY
jgi:capsular exopolysaccharide synthesis family protein